MRRLTTLFVKQSQLAENDDHDHDGKDDVDDHDNDHDGKDDDDVDDDDGGWVELTQG